MKELFMAFQSPLRLMRLNEVLDLTGLSRATLYRKIAGGTFPPQHKLATRCCGWRVGEVDVWLRNPMTFTISDLDRDNKPDGGPD
ncbi:AlpA family phage regulatory protein [Sphingopyxis sp.]|uniref:helix-turn-helix transcriptional regulator n=1 Tax=Sphingopyxis sp. TaxID=1908224 RepID=UPI00338F09D7